jgi:hypothetical protein
LSGQALTAPKKDCIIPKKKFFSILSFLDEAIDRKQRCSFFFHCLIFINQLFTAKKIK